MSTGKYNPMVHNSSRNSYNNESALNHDLQDMWSIKQASRGARFVRSKYLSMFSNPRCARGDNPTKSDIYVTGVKLVNSIESKHLERSKINEAHN